MRILILVGTALVAASAASSEPQSSTVSGFKTPVITPGGPKQGRAPQPDGPTGLTCPKTTAHQAMGKGRPLAGQNLADLPPANHYKAVYRRVDGCEVPVVVGYGIGAKGGSPKR